MLETGASCFHLSITDIKLGWPGLLLSAVSLFSLATNGCVCAAVRHMKPLQRGSFNWLLLSITVCDIIAAVTLMPLSVAKADLGTLPGPWWVCDLWLYMALTLISVVASHLCLMCVDICLSIQPPPWYSSLSHCSGFNLLKVGLAWLAGLVIPLVVLAWRDGGADDGSQGGDQQLGIDWTQADQLPANDSNISATVEYNGTAEDVDDDLAGCPWISRAMFLVTCCCYLLPLLISMVVYGVTWLRIRRALKGVFVRGVRSGSSADKAVKEVLLPTTTGSIRQNGGKGSDLAHKLTASLKRSNSGSRRSKRESSIQHRASVLDRHPSLRYSIKRQPSGKSETARASIRRSRKSSPNPSHSGLHGDHQGLVAKLSWNSAVSDIDRSHSASPSFLDKVPICHSIADLISTHSNVDPSAAQPLQTSCQQQNASYCNLYVEQNKGYNWCSSERLSQNDITILSSEHPAQTPEADPDVGSSAKEQGEVDKSATGSLLNHSDNIPFVDEPEIAVPIILNKGMDDLNQPEQISETKERNTSPDPSSMSNVGRDKEQMEAPGNDEDIEKSKQEVTAEHREELKESRSGTDARDGADTHIPGESTVSKTPSGLDAKLCGTTLEEDNQSINRNLLTASYHYESLSVSEENTPKDRTTAAHDQPSPSHRTRHTIHDTRNLIITLGMLLIVHYLTCLLLIVSLMNSIRCSWRGTIRLQQFVMVSEWMFYAGIVARPFLYVGFHLNMRRALCDVMKCST